MSFGVLLMSVVFAIIETALSWALLAVEPVANFVAGIPVWATTGGIFALGMFLSFILILFIGGAGITDKAADFVKDHIGRVLVLMLISVILVGTIGCGVEILYQLDPVKRVAHKEPEREDIVFILDYSGSMENHISTPTGTITRREALQEAFESTVNNMSDSQRICVVCDDGYNPATIVFGWTELTSVNRPKLIDQMKNFQHSSGNDFNAAVSRAGEFVQEALNNRRSVKVLMISDGQDHSFRSVNEVASQICSNGIKIDTIGIGDVNDPVFFEILQRISGETGGIFTVVGDSVTLETAISEVVNAGENLFGVSDMLITARHPGRQTIINATALRLILLTLISFVFKFIVNICIGNNGRSLFGHILLSLIVSVVSAVIVEFGYNMGFPTLAIIGVFWLLLMSQIVIKDR